MKNWKATHRAREEERELEKTAKFDKQATIYNHSEKINFISFSSEPTEQIKNV